MIKKFIKYFFIVLFTEIALWILIILIQTGRNSFLRQLAYLLQELLSLPLSLIDRSYPYWSPDGAVIAAVLIFATLVIHTVLALLFVKAITNKTTVQR